MFHPRGQEVLLELARRQASEVCKKGLTFEDHEWEYRILVDLADMMIEVAYATLGMFSHCHLEQPQGNLPRKMGPQLAYLELMIRVRHPCLRSCWLKRGLLHDA